MTPSQYRRILDEMKDLHERAGDNSTAEAAGLRARHGRLAAMVAPYVRGEWTLAPEGEPAHLSAAGDPSMAIRPTSVIETREVAPPAEFKPPSRPRPVIERIEVSEPKPIPLSTLAPGKRKRRITRTDFVPARRKAR